ncbi:erythrose 4-phosphate dehydrogenase [Escherichia coli]|nr:erythrose 4-phosphate dehydrogenase [Escherichia coli]EFO3602714.1 erythrose 4-phosphate dehydrogenase [Escherichia coli]
MLDYSVWKICSGKTLQEIYDRTRSDKWLRSHRA